MANLLSPGYVQRLRREYRLRLAVVGALFVLGSVCIGIVFLLPGYSYAVSERSGAKYELSELRNRVSVLERSADAEILRRAREQVRALSPQGITEPTELLTKLLVLRPDGILIENITLQGAQGSGAEVIIGGVSQTRDSLVRYEALLKKDAVVASVDLPVSNLAKEANLDFSMRVRLK